MSELHVTPRPVTGREPAVAAVAALALERGMAMDPCSNRGCGRLNIRRRDEPTRRQCPHCAAPTVQPR